MLAPTRRSHKSTQPRFSGARGTARPAPTHPHPPTNRLDRALPRRGRRGSAPGWGSPRSSEAESGGGTGRGG
ncbi:hypothetical protein Sipo8835_44725, partial [Streptomyces ipomoeae]